MQARCQAPGLGLNMATPKRTTRPVPRSHSHTSLSVARTFPSRMDDTTFNDTHVPGSHIAATSPGCVRTTKEYAEEMDALKRENFNLKLRIYFEDERRSQLKGLNGVDEVLKKNIELSIELETMRKDLTDKEDLLIHTAKAMELLQDGHKQRIDDLKKQMAAEKDIYETRINSLEKTLQEFERQLQVTTTPTSPPPHHWSQFEDAAKASVYGSAFGYPTSPHSPADSDKIRLLQQQVGRLENELTDELDRCAMLEGELKSKESETTHEVAHYAESLKVKAEQLSALQASSDLLEKDLQAKNKELVQKELKLSELMDKVEELELQVGSGSTNQAERRKGKEKSNALNLEAKLEAAVRENKRLKDELSGSQHGRRASSQEPKKRGGGDERELARLLKASQKQLEGVEEQMRLVSERLCTAETALAEREAQVAHCKQEYRKACKAVQGFLKQNKALSRDMDLLKAELAKREGRIRELEAGTDSGGPYDEHDQACLEEMNTYVTHMVKERDYITTESKKEIERLQSELQDVSSKLAKVIMERDCKSQEKEKEIQLLNDSLREKEIQIKAHEVKSGSLEERDNKLLELEKEVSELKLQLSTSQNNDNKVAQELEEEKKEVQHLKEELKKRTFNLQELVNHELWDKNREIEKLNKACEKKQLELLELKKKVNSLDIQVSRLQEKLAEVSRTDNTMDKRFSEIQQSTGKNTDNVNLDQIASWDKVEILQEQLHLSAEKNKFLLRKVEELKEKLHNTPERDGDSLLVQSLRRECTQAKREAETAEKSRKEVLNACTLLTTRLEELADFLDSLLPLLGAKKRRVLQQAVERSRELSRTFSASFAESDRPLTWPNLSQPILPDFSQVDFFSGDDLTVDVPKTIEELTDAENKEEVIAGLRKEIENLKEQLKQRDVEIIKIGNEKSISSDKKAPWCVWDSRDTNDMMSFNLSALASLCGSQELEDITEGSLFDACPSEFSSAQVPPNDVKCVSVVQAKNTQLVSETKIALVPKGDKKKAMSGSQSESEGWSEPDRDVSLARIGLKEDSVMPSQRVSTPESGEASYHSPRGNVQGKRLRDSTELRRLTNRIRCLEQVNEAQRAELSILHKLAPPEEMVEPPCMENGTAFPNVPVCLLDEIRNQREKLESSLFHNDYIRKQLEGVFSSLNFTKGGDCGDKVLTERLKDMTLQLESSEGRSVELESKYKQLQTKCSELEIELARYGHVRDELLANLKERDNEVLEKQCLLLEEQNRALELEKSIHNTEAALKEAEACTQQVKLIAKEIEEEKQTLKVRVSDLEEEYKREQARLGEECRVEKHRGDEWKEKWEGLQCQLIDAEVKMEQETKLKSQLAAATASINDHKDRQAELLHRVHQMEHVRCQRETEWRRQLDSAALTTSEAVLERTRLANDKLRLQQEIRRHDANTAHVVQMERVKRELESRVAELEAANSELEARLVALHNNSDCEVSAGEEPSSPHPKRSQRYTTQHSNELTSDYTSEQEHQQENNGYSNGRSNNNASPDLGIESDQGRMSSLESHPLHTMRRLGETTKLEEENMTLRRHLEKTRCALQETLAQLTSANLKKKKVERAICKQIQKTHSILQKARVNLETDVDLLL